MVPTLTAGAKLAECLWSLQRQTMRDFEVVVVDNSGRGIVRAGPSLPDCIVLEQDRNIGFGAAVNEGFRRSRALFLATLNDDAVAAPGWLQALTQAIEASPDTGMCASRVILAGGRGLDSAGMVLCGDGSSKQRGHRWPPAKFDSPGEVLFPSGSAAMYRRRMLEEIGLFDKDFFLYCEDTDLGLRARWAGWRCLYVPEAVVEHHYSESAGRASPLKAYYVERNRIYVAVKNFPAGMLARAPWVALRRYFWHAVSIARGRGAAAEFQREGNHPVRLAAYVARAHLAAAASLRRLWRQRREIRRRARLTSGEFQALAAAHSISPRQVAEL